MCLLVYDLDTIRSSTFIILINFPAAQQPRNPESMERSPGRVRGGRSCTLRMSVLVGRALSFLVFSSVMQTFPLFTTLADAAGQGPRIDTHAHFVPPFYADVLESKGLTSGGLTIPKWNANEHLALMDSLNIQISVLSASTPGARFTSSDVEEGRKLARQLNEYAHMVTVEYPNRFQFFATLTLPDVEGSVAEAIYALDTLKAAGVVLMANSQGEYLGTRKFDPLMEVLDARGATVFVHPSELDLPPVKNDIGEGKEMTISPYVLDFLLDTTRAAQNLVAMGVTKRYPNIKFILAHSGGFMPFAAYRMAGALSKMMGESPLAFLKELRTLYVDTTLSSSPTALPSTLSIIPHDHITFGTDYPYAPTYGVKLATKSLDDYDLPAETRDSINFHSANGLFEKPLSQWRRIWSQNSHSRDL